MAKSKNQKGKGAAGKKSVANERTAAPDESESAYDEAGKADRPTSPLRAFPADPAKPNVTLLFLSCVLFAVWFCYLVYVALMG
ncbi:hypothetical protein NA78x_004460 [Anatilimnocola sp. NA78]|uniref:hypothetical protein n=1 Tax=Anatilimnocola sp. NA78 TaxID=3415683 RepID=UPI003CE57DAE